MRFTLTRSSRAGVQVCLIAIACAGFICIGTASVAAQQQSDGLFVAAPDAAVADRSVDRTVARSRYVRVMFDDLGTPWDSVGPKKTVLLNLFERAAYIGVLDRVDRTTRGFVWVGHIPDVEMSTVTLASEDRVLYGSVLTREATYVVRPKGNGIHEIAELDPSAFPAEEPKDTIGALSKDVLVGSDSPGPITASESAPDNGSLIDVMVLYTPAAAAAAGGTAGMSALINSAVSITNTTNANSGVVQRLRLAYSGPVAYTETGDIFTDLNSVTYGYGTLGGVAGLRNTYYADLVTLITHTPGSAYCGVAWLMQSVSTAFESHGYNVVEQSCAVGNLSFPHELGHNMGTGHDWYVDGGVSPYTYSHGYVDTSARWRTVMAYADICYDWGFYCPRLAYWANPTVTYGGAAMGVPGGTNSDYAQCYWSLANPRCDADDHRALNETALTVANFRTRPTVSVTSLTANVTFPVVAGTSVTWTAAALGGASPYTYQFWLFNGSTWVVGRDWGASNTWTWESVSPGSYIVQVWARSAGTVNFYDGWREAGATISPRMSVASLTSSVAFPSPAGTPVTWTATPSGGTAPYAYQFWVSDGATWTIGRAWSASNTWSWEPAHGGAHVVQVWARNAGSANAFDAWFNAGATISTPGALTVTSVTTSAPTAAAGEAVTWTVTSDGGTAPYTYQFWVYDGAQWRMGQDWSPSMWVWTPPTPGTYIFQVWARNAGASTWFDAYRSFGPFTATRPSLLTATALTPDRAGPVPAGTPVNWTAVASGGTGPYTYQFWVGDGAAWSLERDWSAASTWTWIPATTGTASVRVRVRNAGSSAPYDAERESAPYPVGNAAALTVTGLVSDRTFPVPQGTPVTWTASAAGGSGPYTYKFFVYNGVSWSVGQDWSATPTWTWTPAAPANYIFQVWVRNAGSGASYDAYRDAGPATIGSAAPLAVTSVTVSPLGPLVAGAPAVVTATGTGGTGPYAYQFWVFDDSSWSVGQSWSASNTFTWTPLAPGTYTFQVWIRNAGSAGSWNAWGNMGPLNVIP